MFSHIFSQPVAFLNRIRLTSSRIANKPIIQVSSIEKIDALRSRHGMAELSSFAVFLGRRSRRFCRQGMQAVATGSANDQRTDPVIGRISQDGAFQLIWSKSRSDRNGSDSFSIRRRNLCTRAGTSTGVEKSSHGANASGFRWRHRLASQTDRASVARTDIATARRGSDHLY